MDPATLETLLGPVGLTAFLLVAILAFTTERVVPGSRALRAETAAKESLNLAVQANDALEKMADALEERNKLDAERMRMTGDRRVPA